MSGEGRRPRPLQCSRISRIKADRRYSVSSVHQSPAPQGIKAFNCEGKERGGGWGGEGQGRVAKPTLTAVMGTQPRPTGHQPEYRSQEPVPISVQKEAIFFSVQPIDSVYSHRFSLIGQYEAEATVTSVSKETIYSTVIHVFYVTHNLSSVKPVLSLRLTISHISLVRSLVSLPPLLPLVFSCLSVAVAHSYITLVLFRLFIILEKKEAVG